MSEKDPAILNVLKESRHFPPPAAFRAAAHVKDMDEYERMWRHSIQDPEGFWGEQARQMLSWSQSWQRVLDWQEPHARWFVGAKLNASVNCLDRHLDGERRDKAALLWEGEPGDRRMLTYAELHREVCRFANALKKLGVVAGDCVTIYMPMVPELVVSMLACARLGVVHNVVFGGFSSEAIADRNNDAKAKLIITADGGWRRGQIVPLKQNVDAALAKSPTVRQCIVLRRTASDVAMQAGRDLWWHELIADEKDDCPAVALDSEHPLFMLYTSGSTGRPKGIVHATGGYLLGAALTSRYVFDLKDDDIYWCTADIGWITGHTYAVYGPLANGASVVMYEGAPNFPDWGRFWDIVARYGVSIFYTAPTAIRACIKAGESWPKGYDLSSLRLLGTVGEPINPEAWMWYHQVIGAERCPIVDTWWQTETGAIMISPLPGATAAVPGSATRPFFGIDADIVDKDGRSLPANEGGFLVVRQAWPSMMRTIHGDDARFRRQYFEAIPGVYFTGDGARRDEHGNFWILGRIDDVLNVAGHRLATMEIESALVSHEVVAEAAVVGYPHEVKGEAICCFVSLEVGCEASDALRDALARHVVGQIGALARPDQIRFADALPKTRSGKIMRRLLRDIAAGRETGGDVTTLEDLSVLARLRADEDV